MYGQLLSMDRDSGVGLIASQSHAAGPALIQGSESLPYCHRYKYRVVSILTNDLE